MTDWEKLKQYLANEANIWNIQVKNAAANDPLLPYFRGRAESIKNVQDQMFKIETVFKGGGCCS